MQRTAWVLAIGLFLVGCQRGGEPTTAKVDPKPKPVETAPDTPSEVAQASAESASEAAAIKKADFVASVSPSTNESPEKVVRKFVEALKDGDAKTVTKLLTDKARYETRRHGLEVKPQLLPQSSFEIAETQYASERKDIAYVSCRWLDAGPEGEAFEIIWITKRQQDGWRISGLATPLTPGTTPKLLNFENVEEMLSIMETAAEVRSLQNQ